MLTEICDFGTELQFPHRSLLIFTTVFIHQSHLTGLMNQTKHPRWVITQQVTCSLCSSGSPTRSTTHTHSQTNTQTHEHTGSIHQLQTCTCSTWLLWSRGGRGRASRWNRWSEGIRLQTADCVLLLGISEKSFIYCPCLTFQRSHSVYNKRHVCCVVTSIEVYILKSKQGLHWIWIVKIFNFVGCYWKCSRWTA